MDKRKEILIELGLGNHEALVYSALLEESSCGATKLSKKVGLARSSVYTTLSALISKGLVGEKKSGSTTEFKAGSIEALETYLEKQKANSIRKLNILSSSKSLFKIEKIELDESKPEIITFSGVDGLKRIYLQMLRDAKSGDELLMIRDEFVWNSKWRFIFEPQWHIRVRKIRREKNIKAKLLVNNSKIEKTKQNFYKSRRSTTFRFLPKDLCLENYAEYIIGNTMCVLSTEKDNPVGIFIRNKTMAKNSARIFENIWKNSK